jgi:inner membrane protein involved in colicin E2 resistance
VYLRFVRRVQYAIVALAFAIPIGFVGAWAVNPGSGAVLHSYLLWHIFGGIAEIGMPVLLLLIVFGAAFGVVHRRRSGNAH